MGTVIPSHRKGPPPRVAVLSIQSLGTSGDQVEHRLAKVVRLEGFGDECVGSTFVGTAARFLLGVRRENYDRQ